MNKHLPAGITQRAWLANYRRRVFDEEQRIPRLVTRSTGSATAFCDQALAQGHEGLLAKSLDSPNEAGNRDAQAGLTAL